MPEAEWLRLVGDLEAEFGAAVERSGSSMSAQPPPMPARPSPLTSAAGNGDTVGCRMLPEELDGGGGAVESSPATSWAPLVDLAEVAAGDDEPPRWLQRSDGVRLLYPGRLHWISGEPETLKTWIALWAVIDALTQGARVAFIDLEDDAAGLVARLDALGMDAIEHHAAGRLDILRRRRPGRRPDRNWSSSPAAPRLLPTSPRSSTARPRPCPSRGSTSERTTTSPCGSSLSPPSRRRRRRGPRPRPRHQVTRGPRPMGHRRTAQARRRRRRQLYRRGRRSPGPARP